MQSFKTIVYCFRKLSYEPARHSDGHGSNDLSHELTSVQRHLGSNVTPFMCDTFGSYQVIHNILPVGLRYKKHKKVRGVFIKRLENMPCKVVRSQLLTVYKTRQNIPSDKQNFVIFKRYCLF